MSTTYHTGSPGAENPPNHSAGTPAKTPKKAALASWIGSALEYYDFAVYGTAAALVLNHIFFPEDASPGVAILFSMGTVGVAYVVRPLGALIMGPLGDKYGRKFVLMLTLFMMGGATFLVGCLPTYDQAGLLAPALLVLCRVIQGLSASGEQASAISVSLEHSDDRHRAFTTSWTLQGTQFGTLLATAVFIPFTLILTEEQLFSWGWRVPFWASAVVVFVAYMIRRHLEEPPAFEEAQAEGAEVKRTAPLSTLLKYHKAAVIRIAAAAMVNTINVVFLVWSLSFATSIVGLERSTMLWVSVVANFVALFTIPAWALLADKIGRKPVFVVGVLGAVGFMFPYLAAVSAGNWTLIFVLGALVSGCFYSMANGIWPSFYAEMFPTRVRVTGLALGTQIGFAISGGLTPILATSVAGADGAQWMNVALVVAAAGLISVVAALTAKETKDRSLDEIDDLHTTRTEALELGALDRKETAAAGRR
ncbi:MFS transporter [Kocuria sp. WRN011]|uniref:MFS transporter n=1 Tax=Kocuria sp. WRN011 TaxID=2029858 RepID=UPI000BAF5CD5|nr:MFS transporter [Kocuria sp. WRN011]PBB08883.1 MFS transporter [Kocuria sp. WRN011]